MPPHRRHLGLCIALLAGGCAPGEAPRGQAATAAPPTAQDITDAMGHSMPSLPEGGDYICAIPTNLKCVPTRRPGRFQCAYRAKGAQRSAVVERTGRTEWERRGHWRWVSGWRRCDILF
jgi:hypothetical protein